MRPTPSAALIASRFFRSSGFADTRSAQYLLPARRPLPILPTCWSDRRWPPARCQRHYHSGAALYRRRTGLYGSADTRSTSTTYSGCAKLRAASTLDPTGTTDAQRLRVAHSSRARSADTRGASVAWKRARVRRCHRPPARPPGRHRGAVPPTPDAPVPPTPAGEFVLPTPEAPVPPTSMQPGTPPDSTPAHRPPTRRQYRRDPDASDGATDSSRAPVLNTDTRGASTANSSAAPAALATKTPPGDRLRLPTNLPASPTFFIENATNRVVSIVRLPTFTALVSDTDANDASATYLRGARYSLRGKR